MQKQKQYLLVVAFLSLAFWLCLPWPVHAGTLTGSGNVDVTALVPGPPPGSAPTIDSPITGSTFTVKNITITGGCITGLIIKIFENNQFVGSTVCSGGGTYQLSIDLTEGTNQLFARQYDSFNQPSPPSPDSLIYYMPPQATPALPSQISAGPLKGSQAVAIFGLAIDYDYTTQNVFAGQDFYLPIRFIGGIAPYAVSVNWGDGHTTLASRQNTDPFTTDHIYTEAGLYTVTIQVSDRLNDQASLQFVMIVNGTPTFGFVRTPFGDVRTTLSIWGILGILCTIIVFAALIGFLVAKIMLRKKQRKKQRKKR